MKPMHKKLAYQLQCSGSHHSNSKQETRVRLTFFLLLITFNFANSWSIF